MPSKIRPTRWCFTWNNPGDGGEGFLRNLVDTKVCRYLVCQVEKGEAGTEHMQGYCEFYKQTTLMGAKKILPRAHWEVSSGTADENKQYCTKEETRVRGPWEFGVAGKEGSGARNDLMALKECLDTKGEEAAWDEHFGHMLRYPKGIEKYLARKAVKRNWLTKVEFHFGVPGTGKTELVLKENPDAYWLTPGKWWQDYKGEEVVVLDEFNGWLPYCLLTRLCDCTPMAVENKFGSVQFVAKKIVFISNYEPDTWYGGDDNSKKKSPVNIDALMRRINRDGGIWIHKKNEEPQWFATWDDYKYKMFQEDYVETLKSNL